MKKLIYSLAIGTLLIASVSAVASAAGNSLIGKKVQKVIAVTVNGKEVKDAVIIDGVTYAPVRSYTEAAGDSLKIEGGILKVTTKENTGGVATKEDQAPAIREQIYKLNEQVKWYQADIQIAKEEVLPPLVAQLEKEKAYTTDVSEHAKIAEAVEKKITEQRAYIADLQKKIDFVNEEIAQLEALLK